MAVCPLAPTDPPPLLLLPPPMALIAVSGISSFKSGTGVDEAPWVYFLRYNYLDLYICELNWQGSILLSVSHKKAWNNGIYNDMNGHRDCHTEWNKSDREGEISYDIPYMWNLKEMIQMNLQNRSRLTDLENKLMVAEEKIGGRDS